MATMWCECFSHTLIVWSSFFATTDMTRNFHLNRNDTSTSLLVDCVTSRLTAAWCYLSRLALFVVQHVCIFLLCWAMEDFEDFVAIVPVIGISFILHVFCMFHCRYGLWRDRENLPWSLHCTLQGRLQEGSGHNLRSHWQNPRIHGSSKHQHGTLQADWSKAVPNWLGEFVWDEFVGIFGESNPEILLASPMQDITIFCDLWIQWS